MLHRSNAEDALWNERDSHGEAAGQSSAAGRRRVAAGTWPGAVFGRAGGASASRKDLSGSLLKMTD